MAMEIYVLSDKELRSIAEWQAAIDAEGYPLQLDPDVEFETHWGFLPAHLRGNLTGFECDHFPADEFMREMSDVDFGHDWKYALAFRWRGDFNEMRAALIASSAYAKATDGVVFDDQEGKVRNAAEALKEARIDYESPDPDAGAVVDKVLRNLKLGPYRDT
jgi:hypothetical protein